MSLKFIDGFDQYQGQVGAALLTSLSGAGYSITSGIGIGDGRKAGSFALELQVAAGAAGASWSSRTNTITQDLRGIAANDTGRWVAVGNAGVAVTSTDSATWSPVVLGVDANMKAIKCNVNTYIAVGDGGTILRSTDGRNFDLRSAPINTANLRDVAHGNGKWMAVGVNGTTGVVFLSEDDGLTWSQVASAAGPSANQCVAFGDVWMIGGAGGQLLTAPPDGLTITSHAFGVATTINAVGFNDGSWLAATGRDIRRSSNAGASWSNAAVGIVTSGAINALVQADGRWIAAADSAALRMSDDNGTTWTSPQFVGAGSTNMYALAVSRGAQVGWCVVGAKLSSGTNATIYVSLAPPTKLTRTFSTSATKAVIGFAHKSTARGRILSIDGLLDLDWPAGISMLDVDGSAIPSRNIWYYYELTIDKTAQTVTLHINNTLDLTAPLPTEGLTMTDFGITWIAENGAVTHLDDIYLLDSASPAGELLVNRLGPISIPIRLPTADSVTQWVPSAPGPHWPLVGILPPSSDSYVRSAVSGAQDLYTSSTALPDGAGGTGMPILAVGLVALAQKGDIDNRQLGLVVGAPGLQKEVVDTTLSITPEYSYAIFEKAPGNVAWDASNVVSTPFGIAVRP